MNVFIFIFLLMCFINFLKKNYQFNFIIKWVYFILSGFIIVFCSLDSNFVLLPSFIYIFYCFLFNFLFLFYFPRIERRSIRILLSILVNITGINSCILLLLLHLHYVSFFSLKYIKIESSYMVETFPYTCLFNYFMLLDENSHIVFQLCIRLFVLILIDFLINFLLVSLVFYLNYVYSLWLEYVYLMTLVELSYSFSDFLWYLLRLAFVHHVRLLRSLFLVIFFIILLLIFSYVLSMV